MEPPIKTIYFVFHFSVFFCVFNYPKFWSSSFNKILIILETTSELTFLPSRQACFDILVMNSTFTPDYY